MEYKSNARFHSLAGLLIVACGTSSTPDDTNGSSTTEVGSSSGVFTTSDTGTSGNTSSTGATSSSEAGSESTSGGVAGLGCGDTVVPIPVFADAEGAPADGRVLGLGDLDGDAQLDALLLAPGASPRIVLGSSEGWGDVETISEVTALAVAMGDLNGDQVLDLAVVTTAEHALVTLVGAGDGTFAVADMVDLGGAVPLAGCGKTSEISSSVWRADVAA